MKDPYNKHPIMESSGPPSVPPPDTPAILSRFDHVPIAAAVSIMKPPSDEDFPKSLATIHTLAVAFADALASCNTTDWNVKIDTLLKASSNLERRYGIPYRTLVGLATESLNKHKSCRGMSFQEVFYNVAIEHIHVHIDTCIQKIKTTAFNMPQGSSQAAFVNSVFIMSPECNEIYNTVMGKMQKTPQFWRLFNNTIRQKVSKTIRTELVKAETIKKRGADSAFSATDDEEEPVCEEEYDEHASEKKLMKQSKRSDIKQSDIVLINGVLIVDGITCKVITQCKKERYQCDQYPGIISDFYIVGVCGRGNPRLDIFGTENSPDDNTLDIFVTFCSTENVKGKITARRDTYENYTTMTICRERSQPWNWMIIVQLPHKCYNDSKELVDAKYSDVKSISHKIGERNEHEVHFQLMLL